MVLLIQLRSFLPTGFFCGGFGMLIQGTFGGLHCPAAVCFSLLRFSNRVTLSIHPIHVGSLVLRGEGFIHRRAPRTLLPLSLPLLVSLKSCTWDDASEDALHHQELGSHPVAEFLLTVIFCLHQEIWLTWPWSQAAGPRYGPSRQRYSLLVLRFRLSSHRHFPSGQ